MSNDTIGTTPAPDAEPHRIKRKPDEKSQGHQEIGRGQEEQAKARRTNKKGPGISASNAFRVRLPNGINPSTAS